MRIVRASRYGKTIKRVIGAGCVGLALTWVLAEGIAFATPSVINLIGPFPDGTVVNRHLTVFNTYPNLSGLLLRIHVADPSEVDILSVTPQLPAAFPGGTVLFPNVTTPQTLSFQTMVSILSGVTCCGASNATLDIAFRVKGTSTGANSDADFTAFLSPILHTVAGGFSTLLSQSAGFGIQHAATGPAIPEPGAFPLMASGLGVVCLAIHFGTGWRRRD